MVAVWAVVIVSLLFPYAAVRGQLECPDGVMVYVKSGTTQIYEDVRAEKTTVMSQNEAPTASCKNMCDGMLSCRSFAVEYTTRTCRLFTEPITTDRHKRRPDATYFEKVCISDVTSTGADVRQRCGEKLWAAERVRGATLTNPPYRIVKEVPSREHCLRLCLTETTTDCMSVVYDTQDRTCSLNQEDRRSKPSQFTEGNATDEYIENQCLPDVQECAFFPRNNVHVLTVDHLTLASSEEECRDACARHLVHVCRAYAYEPTQQNCYLSGDDSFSLDPVNLPKQNGLSYGERRCARSNDPLASVGIGDPFLAPQRQQALVGHQLHPLLGARTVNLGEIPGIRASIPNDPLLPQPSPFTSTPNALFNGPVLSRGSGVRSGFADPGAGFGRTGSRTIGSVDPGIFRSGSRFRGADGAIADPAPGFADGAVGFDGPLDFAIPGLPLDGDFGRRINLEFNERPRTPSVSAQQSFGRGRNRGFSVNPAENAVPGVARSSDQTVDAQDPRLFFNIPGVGAPNPLLPGSGGLTGAGLSCHFEKNVGVGTPSFGGQVRIPVRSFVRGITSQCANWCRSAGQISCPGFVLDYNNNQCLTLSAPPSAGQQPIHGLAYFEQICYNDRYFVCDGKDWAFERIVGFELSGSDDRVVNGVASRVDCEESCLRETSFVCLSAIYNPRKSECRLRRDSRNNKPFSFQRAPGVEYLENQCTSATVNTKCQPQRQENLAPVYVDATIREIVSEDECRRACQAFPNFTCRAAALRPLTRECLLSGDLYVTNHAESVLISTTCLNPVVVSPQSVGGPGLVSIVPAGLGGFPSRSPPPPPLGNSAFPPQAESDVRATFGPPERPTLFSQPPLRGGSNFGISSLNNQSFGSQFPPPSFPPSSGTFPQSNSGRPFQPISGGNTELFFNPQQQQTFRGVSPAPGSPGFALFPPVAPTINQFNPGLSGFQQFQPGTSQFNQFPPGTIGLTHMQIPGAGGFSVFHPGSNLNQFQTDPARETNFQSGGTRFGQTQPPAGTLNQFQPLNFGPLQPATTPIGTQFLPGTTGFSIFNPDSSGINQFQGGQLGFGFPTSRFAIGGLSPQFSQTRASSSSTTSRTPSGASRQAGSTLNSAQLSPVDSSLQPNIGFRQQQQSTFQIQPHHLSASDFLSDSSPQLTGSQLSSFPGERISGFRGTGPLTGYRTVQVHPPVQGSQRVGLVNFPDGEQVPLMSLQGSNFPRELAVSPLSFRFGHPATNFSDTSESFDRAFSRRVSQRRQPDTARTSDVDDKNADVEEEQPVSEPTDADLE